MPRQIREVDHHSFVRLERQVIDAVAGAVVPGNRQRGELLRLRVPVKIFARGGAVHHEPGRVQRPQPELGDALGIGTAAQCNLALGRKDEVIARGLSGTADLRDIGPQAQRAVEFAGGHDTSIARVILEPRRRLIGDARARILGWRLEFPGMGDEGNESAAPTTMRTIGALRGALEIAAAISRARPALSSSK